MLFSTSERQPAAKAASRLPGSRRDAPALLAPIAPERFLAEIYGHRFVHLPGSADRFADLLTWSALNDLLRNQRLNHPRLRLTKDGEGVREEKYSATVRTPGGTFRRLDVSRLHEQLNDGATLVLDAIDQAHPPIRETKTLFERLLGVYVSVNLYASWGTTHGFDVHWDSHDVFVLQVLGRKRWRIFPPTRSAPLHDDVATGSPPDDGTAVEVELQAGDVLYLPRGWWHDVTAVGEPSLHLTCAVLRPSNVDFLTWAVHQTKANDRARADIPYMRSPRERAEHVRQLCDVMNEVLKPSLLDEYLREQEALLVDPRPTLQAVGDADSAGWDPDAEVLLLASRAHVRRLLDSVRLEVGDRRFETAPGAEPVLAALAAGDGVALSGVLENCGEEFLARLVTAGVATVV